MTAYVPQEKYQNETLWLEPIPPELRDRSVAALDEGDAIGFLIKASNEWGLNLVYMNQGVLLKRGIYEIALLSAFINTRTSNHGWPLNQRDGSTVLIQLTVKNSLKFGPVRAFAGIAASWIYSQIMENRKLRSSDGFDMRHLVQGSTTDGLVTHDGAFRRLVERIGLSHFEVHSLSGVIESI